MNAMTLLVRVDTARQGKVPLSIVQRVLDLMRLLILVRKPLKVLPLVRKL